jgi:hypothetical protein
MSHPGGACQGTQRAEQYQMEEKLHGTQIMHQNRQGRQALCCIREKRRHEELVLLALELDEALVESFFAAAL